ncbi:diguanylate cyclase domain-containing protein [Geodermatophilus sp. DSM 44513]|uniref:diguanylate cyclase domain-containing protein n=1 Tax=Geodermatophilus sp. DSM 44513 TaxID=1528104 RepID=UPI00126CC1D5|nr:diguanylate cyclase [Geodermatophilus sp. DSM 44513]WNV75151.1 diguanylate cyclase [Geodermatophilus sp. DSM 44513]
MELPVSVSIGIAPAGHAGTDPQQLIARADAAMYRAKNNGRRRAEIFEHVPRDSLRPLLAPNPV